MPTLDKALLHRLALKYGPTINLESDSEVLTELLRQLAAEEPKAGEPAAGEPKPDEFTEKRIDLPSYDKTYTEGYNKENYSRSDYTRYDRTVSGASLNDEESLHIPPEADVAIVDRLRGPGPGYRVN